MDCREVQERLLEDIGAADIGGEDSGSAASHLAQCPQCAQFAAEQSRLDSRLVDAIAAPALSRAFRANLRARIAREPREQWPDWLPDVAHWAGSGAAIALCAVLLPVPVPVVLGTGALLAVVAYSLQTLLVSVLERFGS